MTVQVEEIHADVVTVGGPPADTPAAAPGPKPPWDTEELWRAARRRARELDRRVAAEDFDD